MTNILAVYTNHLPPELRAIPWRAHPLDGKLLLFERDSGLNILLEGEETAHLQRVAPRTLLIAVTNACNRDCEFCYRDRQARSRWDDGSLLKFCQEADEGGVLEVAFGGGEPMLFPRWAEFINELYDTTWLGVNFTTNGTLLSGDFLGQITGKYGNIRLSLYEDNDWENSIRLLVEHRARFGVNWMVTPEELPGLEARFLQLLGLGVRDFLFVRYKDVVGAFNETPALAFHPSDYRTLAETMNRLHHATQAIAQIKLDVCWGDMLPDVPRLFLADDCNAGDDYLSITCDKRVKACSFMSEGVAFETVADVKRIWRAMRQAKTAAPVIGCGRLAGDRTIGAGVAAFQVMGHPQNAVNWRGLERVAG